MTSMGALDDATVRATRLVGGVWGHLVGDAVGVPYEFRPARPASEIDFGATGMHGQPPGTWSDDGALMLALLDSLLADGGFDTDDQGRRALAWWRMGAYAPGGLVFDIGNTTSAALRAIEDGTPAAAAGPTDEYDCGNGSLMRILPVALVGRGRADADLADEAMRASCVTHGHPRAQVACALYVLIAVRLLDGERDRATALADATDALRAHLADDPARTAALEHLLGWKERAGRARVWDSFWSAWDAFADTDSYADAIRAAVAYGNDTDTTAAIAGGLAGIYWTIDGIPADWLAGMRGRDIVAPLADRLLARDGWRTSTTNAIRVNWVDLTAVPRFAAIAAAGGRLGMTFLPGKQRDGWSGTHWRDLPADVARLRDEHRVDTFLLLVEDHELRDARVSGIADVMADAGIALVRFPIRDMDVTRDRDGLRDVLDDVLARLVDGQSVVVACRGGLGRTGTIVGCLLRDGGLDGEAAVLATRAARRKTIDGGPQVEFVHAWDWPERPGLQ